ncbi:creD [Candida jiufengensis]|uniref:creD n=1 Tax=Candida jiufengensis TaxID=497108 RepID=UPI0022258770|nr:creD [Candida jiufengensis]KAI5951808.1 creD [Candida jiufengensis]
MLKKQHHNTSKSTSLFDIRLKNLEHDVLVLKGNEHEAGSALLSGNIVLSVNEPITIKKLSLRLYSTLKLKADLTSASSAAVGSNRKLLNFKKQIYEYNWDSNEFNQYFDHMYENTNGSGTNTPPPQLIKNHSTSSIKGLSSLRSKSSLNLSSLSNNNSSTNLNKTALNHSMGSNHVLVQGNYEIPFSAILPGNIPESIEGLPGCSAVYRLEASIDRGKFHSTMITKKHIRVVRTLTTDAVELSETIAVDNTWPKKVEYSLSCPTRALAIGSGTPISMMLVPLLKGLTLGDIKIQLVEFYSYVGNIPPMHSAERIIASKKVSKPKPNEYEFDKWELETFMKIPASLSKCCQDVDLLQNVKVRHKLKFSIGLVNPDGHVSELRASLPVQLFISPFVTVSSKHNEEVSEDERNGQEDILFTSDSYDNLSGMDNNNSNNNNNGNPNSSNNSSHASLTGLVAPPLYEKHIYDRLWSDVSPIETPITSGSSTPRSRQGGGYGEFSMQPLDSSALSENLRQLSIQRQAQEAESHNQENNVRATFNLDDEDNTNNNNNSNSNHQNDYFNSGRPSSLSRNHSFLKDPLMTPMTPPIHLSRVNSDANIHNTNEMKQVPSYSQAIRSDTMDDLSPAYEPPSNGSNINLNEVNKNLQSHQHKSNLSKNSSLSKLTGSRNSSTNSSPSNSRNVSSTNLSNLLSSSSSKKSSSNLLNLNSLTPSHNNNGNGSSGVNSGPNSSGNSSTNLLSSSPVNHLRAPPQNQSGSNDNHNSISQLSSSASDRHGLLNRTNSSLSLHNLHFLSKKKDKNVG